MGQFPTPYKREALEAYYKSFNLTPSEIRDVDIRFQDAFTFMQVMGVILFIIGIPSNVMVMMVLRSKSMRSSLTALFLTYLAGFNIMNILLGLARYIVVAFGGPDIKLQSETACILHTNLVVLGHMGSNWAILAVGVCKMAYVLVPDTLMKNLPPSFAHTVMITLCVYGYTAISLFGRMIQELDYDTDHGLGRCDPEYLTLSALFVMSITFIIPEIAMFFVNITTIRAYHGLWSQATPANKKVVRVNYIMGIMLFVTDIQLMIAEIPYIIINTFKPLLVTYDPMGAANYLLGCYMATCALYSNYALNCLTLCFFGGVFRRQLRRIFRPITSRIFEPESRWVSSLNSLVMDRTSRVENRLTLVGIFETDLSDDVMDMMSECSTSTKSSNMRYAAEAPSYNRKSYYLY